MTIGASQSSARRGGSPGGLATPCRVGVVDYGMGNLRSVAKAVEAAGAKAEVSQDRRRLEKTDVLVLPGVGGFEGAARVLRQKKLDGFIRAWIEEGRPYLGICLGLQLLFDSSEEAPGVKGLGVLRGRVRKFRPRAAHTKVPHMGWNRVRPLRPGPVPAGHYYFVHSYYADPEDRSVVLAETDYEKPFCSAVARGNLAATQFHPEKSGTAGLRMLKKLLTTKAQGGYR